MLQSGRVAEWQSGKVTGWLCIVLFILCSCVSPILVQPEDSSENHLTVDQNLQDREFDEIDPIQAPATAAIVADAVPVHRLPSLQSEIIHTLSEGNTYPVSGRSSNGIWMYLSIDNKSGGWVSIRYLSVVGAITALEITEVPKEIIVSSWDVAIIKIEQDDDVDVQDRLYVRTEPESFARVIGYVDDGDSYPVLNRSEDDLWLQIPGSDVIPTDNPVGGWIASHYTTLQERIVNPLLAPVEFTPPLPADEPTVTIQIPTEEQLLVRNAPRPDGEVLGYVSDGERYRILDESEQYSWILIEGGQTNTHPYSGWVAGQYAIINHSLYQSLGSSTEPSADTNESIYTVTPSLKAVVRLQGNLLINVRYAPTRQSAIVGYIYSQEPVQIEGRSFDERWYLVNGDSTTANPHGGWIASHLVELSSEVADEFGAVTDGTQRRTMRPELTDFDATIFPYSDKFRYALVNTEGAPLRVRSEPNTTSKTLAFAQDGELYIIADYTENGQWIALQDSSNRWSGWSAAEYLVLLE